MSRKDFELIAGTIREMNLRGSLPLIFGEFEEAQRAEIERFCKLQTEAQRAEIARVFARSLMDTNPRFDSNRFLKACEAEA